MKQPYFLSSFILLILITGILFASGCQQSPDSENARQELLETDRAFSKRSKEVGNFQAFMEYAKDDAVLLKADSYPIIGKNAIQNYFSYGEDSTYVLTWKPQFAKVSASADLGYTFGIYQLRYTSGENKGKVIQGTYTSIWERTPKKSWRFVLDTGNEGLGQ
jgi:ketosteroid isomerase-like protein